jgi:hypothetical protein
MPSSMLTSATKLLEQITQRIALSRGRSRHGLRTRSGLGRIIYGGVRARSDIIYRLLEFLDEVSLHLID